MEFTDRETAHILAALRFSQLPGNDIRNMEHFEEAGSPLTEKEVNGLCERWNCEVESENCYTVVGIWPDSELRGRDLQAASFVEHVEAESPAEAIRKGRLQAARRRIAFAAEDTEEALDEAAAEFADEIPIIACFPGHLMDLYQSGRDEE